MSSVVNENTKQNICSFRSEKRSISAGHGTFCPRNFFGYPGRKEKEEKKGKEGRKMKRKKMKERKRARRKKKNEEAIQNCCFRILFFYTSSISWQNFFSILSMVSESKIFYPPLLEPVIASNEEGGQRIIQPHKAKV